MRDSTQHFNALSDLLQPGDTMAPRLVDLSVSIRNSGPSEPGGRERIKYYPHRRSAWGMTRFFPGLRRRDLPDGEGWAYERIRLSTHHGTHLDAPYHYASTMDRGKRAMTIDEIPLEWCFQPGIKLDFRKFADGYVVTAADIDAELARIGHQLTPLEIVLVNTSAGGSQQASDYVDRGCGMGREATMHLLDRGVRVTGTDAWSWDAPFVHTARRFRESGDPSIVWEGHRVGRDIGYCHLEKLGNLEALPAKGFKVCCFPVKIEKASAGWTRAVAIVE